MKTMTTPKHMSLTLAVVASTLRTILSAAPIIDWSGDYVSGNQATPRAEEHPSGVNFDGTSGDRARGRSFSPDSALSPSEGASYSGTSATFYGGSARARGSSASSVGTIGQAMVEDNGANDRIRLYASSGNYTSHSGGLVVWKKGDFLGGYAAATLSLNPADDLLVDEWAVVIDEVTAGEWTAHLLIQNGSDFYVSTDSYSAGSVSLTGAQLASMTWRRSLLLKNNSFDGMSFGYAPSGATTLSTTTVLGATFTDIQGFGIVAAGLNSGGDAVEFRLSGFTVSGTPIPQKGTAIAIR